MDVPTFFEKKRRFRNTILSKDEIYYLRLLATNMSIEDQYKASSLSLQDFHRLRRDIRSKMEVKSDAAVVIKAFDLKILKYNDYANPYIISSAIHTAHKIIDVVNAAKPDFELIEIKIAILKFWRKNKDKFSSKKEDALDKLPYDCVEFLFLKSQGLKKIDISNQLNISYYTERKYKFEIFNFFKVKNYFWAIRRALDYGVIPKAQFGYKTGVVTAGIYAEQMLSIIKSPNLINQERALLIYELLLEFYTYMELDKVDFFINRNKIFEV